MSKILKCYVSEDYGADTWFPVLTITGDEGQIEEVKFISEEVVEFFKERNNKEMKCMIDGNAICIYDDDFINIVESECVFQTLFDIELDKFKKLFGVENGYHRN